MFTVANMKRVAYFFFLAVIFTACGHTIELDSLTVEMQDGSQPLATAEPRFSWRYKTDCVNGYQTEYRIIVASSEQKAKEGIGDLWDSKQMVSSQMLYIPYEGTKLKSRDHCYWKVFATVKYGKNGSVKTIESGVGEFEISLLSPDDWRAKWIGRNFEDDCVEGHTSIAARYLRKEFNLKKNINKSRLYISGLGVYCAYINGGEVAPDELLKPALSDYTQRIYFNAYDITEMLTAGQNAVCVTLEGGRFTTIRHDTNYLEWCGILHAAHYGLPQLIMQLEVTYTDGTTDTIVSGEGWKITNRGPIRKSNEFDGETYDARMELGYWTLPGYDDSKWMDAVVDYDQHNMNTEDLFNPKWKLVDSGEWPVNCSKADRKNAKDRRPETTYHLLTPQANPNIKVQDRLKPVSIYKKGDKWILDMGQNMVGVLQCYNMDKWNCECGDTVVFRFAETIKDDSTLYIDNLRSAEATDRYVFGDKRTSVPQKHTVRQSTWSPKFTYHGFRYVEISGLKATPKLEDFKGLVLYDEMSVSGSFECSNEVMNAIYRNAYWGIRGNYRSMPTDCPQRDERMGWTGDRTTGCYGESFIFDNHRLYTKWLQDLADCQWENGSLSDVAPAYWRNYTDNMTWPGAFITVADMLHTRFGDMQPIKHHYDAMKLWMLHMKKYYMKDGIVIRDTYGDWCMPPESPELIHSKDTNRMTWPANLSTPFYCYLSGKMAKFAKLLGYDDDVRYFSDEIETVTSAYNSKYLNLETGRYSNNSVTANLLPISFGMVPKGLEKKVFDNIIHKTENDFGWHVSTGVVGIQQLMRTLTEQGRGDLALKIASADDFPSWGYMWRHGATTIWELWNGDTADPSMNSGNHVMLLGDLIIWYYEYLGGIRALEPGYSRIELKPYPIDGLEYVNCSYNSVSGLIKSNWTRKGNKFEWDIDIPANTTAEVWLPTSNGYKQQILASGKHHLISRL